MREIKFRVWDKRKEKMFSNSVIEFFGDGSFCVFDDCSEDFMLMQYTGLKDKNGVEIYEGDIMAHDKKEKGIKIKGDVKWVDGAFRVDRFVELETRWLNCTYLNKYHKTHHVVGNIYENPELCK